MPIVQEMLLPEHRKWMPIYVGALLGFATLMLLTRFALRLTGFGGPIGIEDALIVPAWLGGLAFAGISVLFAYHNDSSEHIGIFSKDPFVRSMLFVTCGKVAFTVGNGFAKISVLLFCRRLVQGTGRWELKAITWGAAVIATAYVAFFIELWSEFTCPWDERVPDYLFTTLAIISDLYATVLPAVIIWKTSMALRKKLALTVLFSMGLLATFASIMRTIHIMGSFRTADILHSIFDALMWANLELQLGIICASAPAVRALFKRETRDGVIKRLGLSRFVRPGSVTGSASGGSPPIRIGDLGLYDDGSSLFASCWKRLGARRRNQRERGSVMSITVTREVIVTSELRVEESEIGIVTPGSLFANV